MSRAKRHIICWEEEQQDGFLAECALKATLTGSCVIKAEPFWTSRSDNSAGLLLTILSDEEAASLLENHLKEQGS